MKENANLARAFTADMTLAAFEADKRTLYAVARCLEIISEAFRRVPAEIKSRHPNIAWRDIASAGNVYRHEYHNIEASLVWDTVQEHLPSLCRVLDAETATTATSVKGLPE